MISFMKKPAGILCVLALMLTAACSTVTQPSAVWMDPAYHSRPHKILVVGIAKAAVNRRIFEDEFVRRLREHGVSGIASYSVLPDELQGDRKAIAGKVVDLGADAVLISRLASRKTVQTVVPGMVYYPPSNYGRWTDYYGYGYETMYLPGYVAEQELAVIESNLYDASNDKLIWASATEIGAGGDVQERIRNYAGIVINAMAVNGLLN